MPVQAGCYSIQSLLLPEWGNVRLTIFTLGVRRLWWEKAKHINSNGYASPAGSLEDVQVTLGSL
jgi:hypothetical protein